jgi:hypothetical protein
VTAFEALAGALAAGLSLWASKEKTKYTDKLIQLRKDHYEESNRAQPDFAVLDNLEFELRLLGVAFSTEVGKQNPPPGP